MEPDIDRFCNLNALREGPVGGEDVTKQKDLFLLLLLLSFCAVPFSGEQNPFSLQL